MTIDDVLTVPASAGGVLLLAVMDAAPVPLDVPLRSLASEPPTG